MATKKLAAKNGINQEVSEFYARGTKSGKITSGPPGFN